MSKHPAQDVLSNLPPTQKVTTQLETAKQVLEEEASKRGIFSPEKKLAKDAAEFVESTKEFIEEKNKGEMLQALAKDIAAAADELTEMYKSNVFFTERYQMLSLKYQFKFDTAKLAISKLESLKNLFVTLVNSGQFRSLLVDVVQLIQETFNAEYQKAPSLTPMDTDITLKQGKEVLFSKAKELTEFGRELATDISEGFPITAEKKAEIKFKFHNTLRTIANDPNYKAAVDGIFTLLDQIQFYYKQVQEQIAPEFKEKAQRFWYSEDSALFKLFTDLKTFIGNFTGEESLNLLIENSQNFQQMIAKDEKVSKFFWEFRQYIFDAINQPDQIDSETATYKWNDLFERARLILNDPKYSKAWIQLWVSFQLCLENIKNDPLQQKLASDAQRLVKDLFLDVSGKPSLPVIAGGVLKVKNLLMPIIQKNLEQVPVPQICGTNEKYDWSINGLLLNIKEILPNNIEVKVWGKANVALKEGAESAVITYMTIWIRNFHIEAKDLKFWFNRKTTPKIEERGIADVSLTGKNELKITWKIQGAESDKAWQYGLEQVNCSLDDLDITIKESTHTWLMKMITSLFSGSIRRSIEDSVEKGIVDGMGNLNKVLYEGMEDFGDRLTDTLRGFQ